MSETPKKTPSDASVDLSKSTPADVSAGGTVAPARPRSLDLVVYLLGLQLVMGFVSAIAIRAMSSSLTDYVWEKATKKDGSHYSRSSAADQAEIARLVHNQQNGAVVGAIVFGLAFVALGWSLRRYRSASVARWALVVVMVFNGGPLSIIPVSGLPVALNVIRVITGLAWLGILVLLFVPDSRAYFRACREAMMPSAAVARPGLRDLLGGGLGRGFGAGRPPARPAAGPAGTPADRAADRPNAGRQKARTRADEAAVAKGAELARARAKASAKTDSGRPGATKGGSRAGKSRRTDV